MKARVLITVASLAAVLAGCGTSAMLAPSVPMAAQPAVQAESFKGIAAALNRNMQAKFLERDTNRNKKITPDEWGIKTPADFIEFRELDDNGDGSVTLEEMQPGFFEKATAYRKLTKAAKFMFKQYDTNGDKKVTVDEAKEIALPGVEAKWSYFAHGKAKPLTRSAFVDFYVELMVNGEAPLKPKPPAPPAPPAPPEPAPPATP